MAEYVRKLHPISGGSGEDDLTPEPELIPEPEPEPEPEVHPLKEGGVRFEEVYARMKAAEDREREKDARLARLEGQIQGGQRPQFQLQAPTPEMVAAHLQTQLDRGEITPMQAANVLSQYNAQRAANTTAIQVEQQRAFNQQMQEAANEVDQYIAKVPALRDPASPELAKVQAAANRVSRRMGLPVTDFRVQQTALESVYGGLDKIQAVGNAREQSRRDTLPHTESGVGGTGRPAAVKGDDALKGVSQKYIDFWTKKGYTKERMIAEAKYVTRDPRSVPSQQR